MLNDVNTILSSLDEFETNINNVAIVLDKLKSINDEYLESINAPKIVMEKVNNLLEEQENKYRNINSQLEVFVKELRGYDNLIKDKVEESINRNLEAINKTTEKNLTEIRENIISLKPIVEKNEEIVVNHTKLLEEKIGELNSFSEKLLNELSSSIIELTSIINSNVNMYINEMRRYDDKIKMYDTTLVERFNSIEHMKENTLELQKQMNTLIKENEVQKLEREKIIKLANINTGILISILVIMIISLFK